MYKLLTKALKTLKDYYRELAKYGLYSPNEAEFMAYLIISQFGNYSEVTLAEAYRPEVFLSKYVQTAIEFHFLKQSNLKRSGKHWKTSENNPNFYTMFFRKIACVPYLFACLLWHWFSDVREYGIMAIQKAVYNRGNGVSFEKVVQMFALNDIEHAISLCEYYGIPVEKNKNIAYFGKSRIKNMNGKEIFQSGAFIGKKIFIFLKIIKKRRFLKLDKILLYQSEQI